MRDDYTHILAIVDASGSMRPLRDDTIGGVNGFIKDQKKVKGKATFSLIQFNSEVNYIYENENLKDVRPMTKSSYVPGGSTALLKAIEDGVDDAGKFLSGLPEDDRPAKVVVLIVTDGQENSSPYPYCKANVSKKINHQRDIYKWEFVFLGANQDAISEGQALGIWASNAVNYAASAMGTKNVYDVLSEKVTLSRGMKGSSVGTMSFSSVEREKCMTSDTTSP